MPPIVEPLFYQRGCSTQACAFLQGRIGLAASRLCLYFLLRFIIARTVLATFMAGQGSFTLKDGGIRNPALIVIFMQSSTVGCSGTGRDGELSNANLQQTTVVCRRPRMCSPTRWIHHEIVRERLDELTKAHATGASLGEVGAISYDGTSGRLVRKRHDRPAHAIFVHSSCASKGEQACIAAQCHISLPNRAEDKKVTCRA